MEIDDRMREQLRELEAMVKEELHPDLVKHVIPGDESRPAVLHHPLVVEIAPIAGLVNRQYEHKLQLMRGARPVKQMVLFERPYRLEMLVHYARLGLLEGEDLKEALRFVWPDMESDDTLSSPLIPKVMDAFRQVGFVTDKEGIEAPTSPMRVFRGGLPDGIAWSRKRGVAEWFANRFGAEPVYRATAPPASVMARFVTRREDEVVLDPRMLREVERIG